MAENSMNFIQNIAELDNQFHEAGVLSSEVIHEIFKLTENYEKINSIETGCGKSTLLFSQISMNHICFTIGECGGYDDKSYTAVVSSTLFKPEVVNFILGPTQKTLPLYDFRNKSNVVFIDGPHGYPFPDLEYYYLYQQLETGGLLILDDIHIPTINNLYQFIKEEEMFTFIKNVATTAFFRRNETPLFNPYGDGWWLQKYNSNRYSKFAKKYFPKTLKEKAYQLITSALGINFAKFIREKHEKPGK